MHFLHSSQKITFKRIATTAYFTIGIRTIHVLDLQRVIEREIFFSNNILCVIVSFLEESKCGKIPVIPNGEVPATPSVYQENDSVDIVCQHGFNAQVSKLTCHRGQWNSNSVQLNEVCKRESFRINMSVLQRISYERLIGWNIIPNMFLSFVAADSNCGAPPKVDNAVIDSIYKKEYLSNFTVSYLCRDGSKIGDENTLQCQDGEWEKKNITCSRT